MTEEITSEEIFELVFDLCSFSYRDVKETLNILKDFDINTKDFVEHTEEYCEEIGTKLSDLDLCALAYNHILNQARTIIEKETKQDISDLDIYVSGNFMCTTFDNTQKTIEFLEKHKAKFKDNEFIQKFIEYLG